MLFPRGVQRDVQEAARTFGLQLNVVHASAEPDLGKVFATLDQLRAGALVIGTDTFLDGQANDPPHWPCTTPSQLSTRPANSQRPAA